MPEIKGLTLPVVKAARGWFTTRTTREVIQASIRMILHTHVGERVFLPEFGSRLDELVFEPSDEVLVAFARQYVVEAIRRWENRITLVDVLVVLPTSDQPEAKTLGPNEFKLTLRYIINTQNVEDNLSFTFKRELQ